MNRHSERGSMMMFVVIVLTVSAVTVALVPRIASEMGDTYRRAIIESAWRSLGDKIRLSMRNPGWISCKSAQACVLRDNSAKTAKILEENILASMQEMADRFECGPSGRPNYCDFGFQAGGVPDLKPKDSKHAMPYIRVVAYFNTQVPDGLKGTVNALPVVLGSITHEVDLPRGVAILDKRFLCNGFLMGYEQNGDPICKTITTKRQDVGRYITEFIPEKMDQPEAMVSDQVPEMVRDCQGQTSFLMNYKWLYSVKYEATCGSRVKPWQVN